jgi:hypothetical protein
MPTTNVSFLSGRPVSVDVPDEFDARAPELMSMIELDGVRSIAYRPMASWEPPPDRNPLLAPAFSAHTGFTRVSVYRSREDGPATLTAFWHLPEGFLNTFMQDDYECGADIEGRLRTVMEHVSVSVSRNGLPMIRVRPPVRFGSPSAPLQREQIVFMPRDRRRDDVSLTLINDPPWVPEGSASRSDGPTAAGFATSSHHVTVRVNGLAKDRAGLKERAERVAGSVRPG